jgi:hypothetical protein
MKTLLVTLSLIPLLLIPSGAQEKREVNTAADRPVRAEAEASGQVEILGRQVQALGAELQKLRAERTAQPSETMLAAERRMIDTALSQYAESCPAGTKFVAVLVIEGKPGKACLMELDTARRRRR